MTLGQGPRGCFINEDAQVQNQERFCGIFLSTLERNCWPHTEGSPVPQNTTAWAGGSQLPSVGSIQNLGRPRNPLNLQLCIWDTSGPGTVVQSTTRINVNHSICSQISKPSVQGRGGRGWGKQLCQHLQVTNRFYCCQVVPSPARTFCRQLLCMCAKFC